MIWDNRTPEKSWWQPLWWPQRKPTISDYTELTTFCHTLIILSFYNINRNLISCEFALQRLYRKKRYTNNLELNWNSVSNSATLKKKDELHALSHRICKYSCTETNTYTFTYLRSLATQHTFYKKTYQKTGIIVYFTIFFNVYCL